MPNNPHIHSAYKAACTLLQLPSTHLLTHPEKETSLFQQLAQHAELSFIMPQKLHLQNVMTELPYNKKVWRHGLPIQLNQQHGWVIANLNDLDTVKQYSSLIHYDLNFFITCPSTLFPLIDKVHHQIFYAKLNQQTLNQQNDHIIECVEHVLIDAIESRASDLHIEPQQHHIQIRLRIDGLLHLTTTLPIALISNIISRIKILAELNITEKRLPQDGRFQFHQAKQSFDCRVSCCPTQYGEKIVIRLLHHHQEKLSLNKIGMSDTLLSTIKPALQKPQGLILITGPTGSGKTQTLYSIIEYLQQDHLNITTIEDPIEIPLRGINQTAIQPKIGLHFSTILRALLRQDPDIIMLGEIRDQETAEIAVRAAQTGHLVLSTLHTNNTFKTLHRLINMGIKPYNLLGCINLIIAQRLIRKLCPHCKIELNEKEKTQAEQKMNLPLYHHRIYKPHGCTHCSYGYSGREGIFEIALPNEVMQQVILNIHQPADTAALTIQDLPTDAIRKIKQGLTSISEIDRIISLEQ